MVGMGSSCLGFIAVLVFYSCNFRKHNVTKKIPHAPGGSRMRTLQMIALSPLNVVAELVAHFSLYMYKGSKIQHIANFPQLQRARKPEASFGVSQFLKNFVLELF